MSKQSTTQQAEVPQLIEPRLDPFTVLIEQQPNKDWEDRIKSGADEAEMIRREKRRNRVSGKASYIDEWKDRQKNPGGRQKPRFEDKGRKPNGDPNHIPVILTRAETVRFECAMPFLILILPDPEFTPVSGASDPFAGSPNVNMPFSRFSSPMPGGNGHFVETTVKNATNTGAANPDEIYQQLFFKMVFVVIENGEPKLGDPDFYCDR